MPDREKIIKGLESMHTRLLDAATRDRIAMLDAIIVADAIALLKAQEPRVMALEEYKALAEKPKEERDPVWEEWPGLESAWAIPNQAHGGYGTSWRCWTSRPTDEQREATPWEQ